MKNKIKKYLFLCIILLFGCYSQIKEYEKEDVLMHIANYYIEEEESNLLRLDSSPNNAIPHGLQIYQEDDYRGFFRFVMFPTISSIFTINSMPTKILKVKNRYVFLYMKETAPISKDELPDELFNGSQILLLYEMSGYVLMCKKCFRSIVLIDPHIIAYDNIKQFNEFTCDCEHDYKKMKQDIIVEEAIIDDMEKFLAPPPPELCPPPLE